MGFCRPFRAGSSWHRLTQGLERVKELAGLLETGVIPLLAEEGWTRHEENVSLPIWRGRGGQFGEIFRPEHFAKLTTPSAAVSVASRLLIDAAATPPLRGGEFGHSARRQFIHTF